LQQSCTDVAGTFGASPDDDHHDDEEALVRTAEPAASSGVILPVGKVTILLVDDAEDLHDALGEALQEVGYAVASAKNGREALDYLMVNPAPDLIVLDLQMPIISGWDLMSIMRSYSRLSKIPVLVISASERLASISHPHQLQKPFTAAQLIEVVEALARKG
jgi:CheY-like chemotaxis protein